MFKRKRSANDFAEEIKAHLELEAKTLEGEGLSEGEARRKARVEFGNVSATQERFYLKDRAVWFDNLVRDVQFAFRQFAKRPGFTCTAIAVLALGIGVSVAIFGFVDAALVRPLPYANPNQLMSVNESNIDSPRWPLSYPDFLDWRNLNKSFVSLDIYGGKGCLLRTPKGPEPVQAERVSASFFQTLGIRPLLGRSFSPGENKLGGPNLVILSYGTWLRRFSAQQNVMGKTVQLDDNPYTVIGVLPRTFSFAPAGNAEFWVPINELTAHENFRNFYNFWGIGRLRDGVTAHAAQAEMSGIARRLQRQYSASTREQSASVVPLAEIIVGDVRPILLTLMGGAGLLLLISCINVASLVLARSESRSREDCGQGRAGRHAETFDAAIRHRGVHSCLICERGWNFTGGSNHAIAGPNGSEGYGIQHAILGRRRTEFPHLRVCDLSCSAGNTVVSSVAPDNAVIAEGARGNH